VESPQVDGDDDVGALSLLGNYIGGEQKDVEANFSQLRTKDVKPEDFSEVRKHLHNAGFDGVAIDIFIENATMNFKGEGADNYLGFGNVELSLTGTLSISDAKDGGGYTFRGILSANDNVYDFDPAENFNQRFRSVPAEVLTIGGAKLPGKPFIMKFKGDREIKSEGVVKQWEN